MLKIKGFRRIPQPKELEMNYIIPGIAGASGSTVVITLSLVNNKLTIDTADSNATLNTFAGSIIP